MTQDRNSIQNGANTGQASTFWVLRPLVVAIETTLKAAWRSEVPKLG
jgi:hypothetical protein